MLNFKRETTETKEKKINTEAFEFKLTALGELDNIFSTMISPDKNDVYYMKADGVYKISIQNRDIIQQKNEKNLLQMEKFQKIVKCV